MMSVDRPRGHHRGSALLAVVALAGLTSSGCGFSALAPDAQGGSAPQSTAPSASADSSAPHRGELRFFDDFDGTEVDTSRWVLYDGPNMWGEFDPDNVAVKDGILTLRTRVLDDGTLAVAGMANSVTGAQTFGEAEVRVRLEPGVGTRGVALLWPYDDDWPPEIDFYEVVGADRQDTILTVHAGTDAENRWLTQESVEADFSQWQTVGVRWSPTVVEFTLNGEVTARIDEDVPQEDMHLALQHHLVEPDAPAEPGTPDTLTMEVDWVKMWEYEES